MALRGYTLGGVCVHDFVFICNISVIDDNALPQATGVSNNKTDNRMAN